MNTMRPTKKAPAKAGAADIPAGWGTAPKRAARAQKQVGKFTLTRASMVSMGAIAHTTQGQQIVARFCAAVERKQTPDMKTLLHVAAGLAPLVSFTDLEEAMHAVAAKLGVIKRQGKSKPDGVGELAPLVRSVIEWQDAVAAGADSVAARKQIADDHGIGDRAMRNRIKDYAGMTDDFRQLFAVMTSLEVKLRK
ncbi:MAG: hypothetical protein QM599_01840 [Pseudoxanthomonas sp.]